MPDNTVITEKQDEKKPLEKTIGQEVREQSFQQILQEDQQTKQKEQKKVEAPKHSEEDDKKAKEEEKLAKEAAEAKSLIEAEENEKKRVEEAAKKAAEEVINKQKAEEEAKLAKVRAEEEAKKREESLKPKFTGVDQNGKVVPKSYEELAEESARIAREKTLAEVEAREKQRSEEQAKQAALQAQTEQQKKDQQKANEDQLQKELDADLKDLYGNNKLPKVKDPKDPNDIGNKEFENLFKTAQRVNAERIAKGEQPIRSIKLIYYEHYKPLEKPAGHDAPVLGNESSLSDNLPEDKYVPSRDRNKSWTQTLREEKERQLRKLNIRGS